MASGYRSLTDVRFCQKQTSCTLTRARGCGLAMLAQAPATSQRNDASTTKETLPLVLNLLMALSSQCFEPRQNSARLHYAWPSRFNWACTDFLTGVKFQRKYLALRGQFWVDIGATRARSAQRQSLTRSPLIRATRSRRKITRVAPHRRFCGTRRHYLV